MESKKVPIRTIITSLQNAQIKKVVALHERKARRRYGEFVVEGVREQQKAFANGQIISEIYICPALLTENAEELFNSLVSSSVKVYELNEACFNKIVVRDDAEGLVLVCKTQERTLKDFALAADPFLLLIEGVEKPGNLGALLRTADGAGVNGVILVDTKIDLLNPNVIRSSLGCCFSIPIAECTRDEIYAYCKEKNIAIYAAVLSNASIFYHLVPYKSRSALLLGSEDQGLDPFWISHADQLVTIPMHGDADSLNVSAAGAVLLYEMSRHKTASTSFK